MPRALLEGGVDALLRELVLGEDRRRLAVADVGDGDQQVLDADELILEPVGLGVGGLEELDDARGGVDLHHVVGQLRRLVEVALDTRHERRLVDAERM